MTKVQRDWIDLNSSRKPNGADNLSAKQEEVLEFIACGLQPKQIASQMEVSVSAVNSNIIKMRKKLGAKNNAHAVAIWSGYLKARFTRR